MPTALTPIAWTSLGTAQSSVNFTSIPNTYRDLRLVIQGTMSGTGNTAIQIRFNSDSATNYSYVAATGDGVSASSYSGTAQSSMGMQIVLANSSSSFLGIFDVLDYSATDKHKTSLCRWNNAANGVEMDAYRWASTTAVNAINIFQTGSLSFAAGTTFALYGVAA